MKTTQVSRYDCQYSFVILLFTGSILLLLNDAASEPQS